VRPAGRRQSGGASTPETPPRTAACLAHLDKASGHLAIVHVFPDAAAMDLHFEGADERAEAAYEFMTSACFEIYGTPSASVLG
jgi:hypothetical protein